jgi:hypothetical protein
MARAGNAVGTEVLKLSTTSEVCAQLDRLATTGLFGKNRSEVAEQLLREKLREHMLQGWTGPKAPTSRQRR